MLFICVLISYFFPPLFFPPLSDRGLIAGFYIVSHEKESRDGNY